MTDESGFYKYVADEYTLHHGPNFVSGPGFDLDRNVLEHRDNELNGSDVHGWFWFETTAEAVEFFDPQEPPEEPIEP